MKAALAVLVLGLFMLIVQGALARWVLPPWCPDLAWLVVLGIGLRWPHFLTGLLLAVTLGYAMDLVSGSLMGQHALMRLVTYLAAALVTRQLDLSGGLPVSIFVGAMTVFYGVAIVTMLSFFVGSPWVGFDVLGAAAGHAIVNVLAAGPIISLVEQVLARFSDEEVGRRSPMSLGFDRRGLDRRQYTRPTQDRRQAR
jgi:cell shape-determining protein MreD